MIIDFRMRMPSPGYLASSAFEVWRSTKSRYGSMSEGRRPVPSMDAGDMDLFVAEMDEAGIDLGVLIGRKTKTAVRGRGNVPVEEMLTIMNRYPGRFEGMAAVDPLDPAPCTEIRRIKAAGMIGVCMEPFWSSESLYLNDERLLPVYQAIEAEGLLFSTTLNWMCGPNTSWNEPEHLEQIALWCPNLPILVVHACYPRTDELMAVAARHPNIYLIPDCYLYFPFLNTTEDQMMMYNHMLKNQVLFGSSYPIRGLGQALEESIARPWLPEARELFLWQNAARLLEHASHPLKTISKENIL